jgi:hypothetical protein
VGRRDHRVAGGQKGGIAGLRRRQNRLGILLDAGAVPDLDRRSVVVLEIREVGPDEPAGVELRERAVGRP